MKLFANNPATHKAVSQAIRKEASLVGDACSIGASQRQAQVAIAGSPRQAAQRQQAAIAAPRHNPTFLQNSLKNCVTPYPVAQLLTDNEKEGLRDFVDNLFRNVHNVEYRRIIESKKQVAYKKETIIKAQDYMRAFWRTLNEPSTLLGDTYLMARNTLRPPKPNDDSSRRTATENCGLVAVAAVLNTTAEELYKKLDPNFESMVQTVFLGPNAKKYNQFGTLKETYYSQEVGETLDEFVTRKLGENPPGDEKQIVIKKRELFLQYRSIVLEKSFDNDDVMDGMVAAVSEKLGDGITVRRGGNGNNMLSIEAGIADMKNSPPGTQFVVLLNGASGIAPHYVYANNLGGHIHFVDYQPETHAHAIGKPSPVPFSDSSSAASPALTNNKNEFSSLSFIAFEPNTRHVLNFIKADENRIYRS